MADLGTPSTPSPAPARPPQSFMDSAQLRSSYHLTHSPVTMISLDPVMPASSEMMASLVPLGVCRC